MAVVAAVFLANHLISPNVASAKIYVPIRFSCGWGSSVESLVAVSPESELAREFPDKSVSIAYKWDEFWLGFPFWVTGHEYLLAVSENRADLNEYFVLDVQDPDKLAELASVSAETLRPPLFSRVPFGYVFAGAACVVVWLISGPSPRKRFERLMQDDRYRDALQMFEDRRTAILETAGVDNSASGTISNEQADSVYAEVIASLVQNGIGPDAANRNVEFMLRFLADNAVEAR
jgi:hypothetical protein